jgi:ubiquinone/menaquinone biosynthesis C-methylase UbiE
MFSDPEKIVPYFGLTDGQAVADFGAGSGHYSLAIAKRVGDRGKVYAVDVQKELLSRLEAEAKSAKIRNIHLVWGNVEKLGGTKLGEGMVDSVVIANLLLLTDAKYTVALEAKRILRAGGKVAVIDWTEPPARLEGGQAPALSADEAKRIFAEAGFIFLNDFPAGEHHFGLLFQKS